MKLTESQLRKIIRKELLREMRIKQPIPLEELQFTPSEHRGDMALPGIGAYKVVRTLEEFENWKTDFLRRYGPTMISRDHNGWNVQNEKFKTEQDNENKQFMTHHRGMEKRLGRKLSY